mmetsp:Transcript_5119/g.11630  ORF Transcript_5119/g.11630 Transcript_5119/m.11630 type:complete len:139 (+) Transcript_5119:79-495(+)
MAALAMTILSVLLFAYTASPASALIANSSASIPITQTVTIDGVEVYSQSSGHGILNECVSFAKGTVNDEARPKITVCGSQTKVSVFLMNRCQGYHTYTEEIGACDSGADSDTCVTASPETAKWLMTAQSYMVTQCATR